jgi:proteasome assembly chaperone (PAC2) family protein
VWQHWETIDEPQLTNPAAIVAVSTSDPRYVMLYSHARELAKFVIRQLGFALFAKHYSSAMPPAVLIGSDGTAELHRSEAYFHKGNRDLILYTADASPNPYSYEYSEIVLEHAKKYGASELCSIGARFLEPPVSPFEELPVLGYGSDGESTHRLSELGVKLLSNEPSYYFSSLVVSMSQKYDMRGYRLSVNHGEPKPHPKSVMAMLRVLAKMFDFGVDMAELEASSKELEESLRKGIGQGEDQTRRDAGPHMYR